MRAEDEGMMLVRAELGRRVDALSALSPTRHCRELAESVDGLKRLALLYGLEPVARVAEAFERSAAIDGACLSRQYLGRLAEAIDCAGEGAAEALIASVSVRLA